MILTTEAVEEVRKNLKAKARLSVDLGISIYTIDKHLRENKHDSDLTKIVSLNIISEETGLDVNQILKK